MEVPGRLPAATFKAFFIKNKTKQNPDLPECGF
jgi:hypothetical protein